MPRKGLDILQQKSWHVLRRHNIEKVRKDQREEKEKNEKEKERQDRALFQSQIESLRKKNEKHNSNQLPTESINLFKIDDLKELKNLVKEKEDIAEADVQARKDGLLNYVGETVLEGGAPWYAQTRFEQNEKTLELEKQAKDDMRKLEEDPFESKFKKQMSWAKKMEKNIKQSNSLLQIESNFDEPKNKKSKKSKKEKKSKKDRNYSNESDY